MVGFHAPDEVLPFGNHDYVADMRESILSKPPETPTGIPDPGTLRTSYDGIDGFWHDDPDSPMMYREDFVPYEPSWMRDSQPKTFRPIHSRQRRKRIETWEENGFLVGRATWEYKSTP